MVCVSGSGEQRLIAEQVACAEREADVDVHLIISNLHRAEPLYATFPQCSACHRPARCSTQTSTFHLSFYCPEQMSDFEDDTMDIDAPNVEDAMVFSAAATSNKGKRSAANLPVELEDSLPWYVTFV